TISRRISSRLALSSPVKRLTPVRLLPGRARPATRPNLTGSSGARNTMGIVVVSALTASAEEAVGAAITLTCRRRVRLRAPAVDPFDFRPSGTPPPRSRRRRNLSPSSPGEIHAAVRSASLGPPRNVYPQGKRPLLLAEPTRAGDRVALPSTRWW